MKKKYQIPESSIKTKVLRASILAGSGGTGTPNIPSGGTDVSGGGVAGEGDPDAADARRRTSPSLLDV